jgi:hypothetical protein
MKKIIAALVLCWAVSLQAEVVIYKIAKTTIWIGNGTWVRETVNGRLVFDPQDLSTAQMITWLPRARFQLDCPQMEVKYMRGPRRSSQSAFFLKGDGYDAETLVHASLMQAYLRGTNANLLIGADSRLIIPKILRGTWEASFEAGNGENFVGQSTAVVASYMGTETRAANVLLQTPDQVIGALVEDYVSRGWIEVEGEAPCELLEFGKTGVKALESKAP